ncbi:hypothetical protein [Aeromicrobium sp. UC242_57]|uniref:hypothetical protein n=1 Tax=Aeromicrobium sp. UC242_57 TaxID=3374624 RepID=UPI0037A20AED
MTVRRPPGRRTARAQGAIAATCFAMLVASSNAINPLLPTYRAALGLDPLVISLTFTLYVATLVVTLFALSRARFTRWAGALLVTSLILIIESDVLLAYAQEWSILTGRIVCGLLAGSAPGQPPRWSSRPSASRVVPSRRRATPPEPSWGPQAPSWSCRSCRRTRRLKLSS